MRSSTGADFAEQVADHGVGPARQILEVVARLAAHRGSAFSGSTMPNSLSRPRMRLMRGGALLDEALACAVHHSRDCCSWLLTGTKRMFGRCTASQIAAASAASFLPRLPLMR